MRRTSIFLAAATVALAAVAPAAADLTISGTELTIRQAVPGDDPPPIVLVLRQGERYRFQLDYAVDGAPRIGTSHLYAVENALTGERVSTTSKSFAPSPGGSYNEHSVVRVGVDWTPGVYRVRYRMSARAAGETSVSHTGARVFLVAAPPGG